jgi:hypothetical protein
MQKVERRRRVDDGPCGLLVAGIQLAALAD